MKICTDIEQSKKLAEFLPKENADMYWSMDEIPFLAFPVNDIVTDWEYAMENGMLPAWSLAALLVAADFITINLFYIDERGYWVVSATIHNSTKLCTKYESAMAFNPVDACYELIIKLHEQNLL